MNIIDVGKEYIRLYNQNNKSFRETKDFDTCRQILTFWSSASNKTIRELFDTILEHSSPISFEVDKILKENLDDEIRAVVSEIFYEYLISVKSEFLLSDELIKEWKILRDEFAIDPDDEISVSDDRVLKDYISGKKTLMYKYILDNHFSNGFLQNKLMVLKGWSSATPMINSYFRNDYCNGGGMYININGVGIVIDPGCNFIKNMHEQGIRIFDIDYVIITHNHVDHNASMFEIQSLNYEYNSYVAKMKNDVLYHKKTPRKFPNIIKWIVDKETELVMEGNRDFKGTITYDGTEYLINNVILADLGTDPSEVEPWNNASKQFLEKESTYDYAIDDIKGKTIRITFFRTYHMKNSFGLKIVSEIDGDEISIGYTSDTGYFKRLPKLLNGCKVLIENISELSPDDLFHEKTDPKATHLKLNGCIKTITKMSHRPKIVIVSEFWGGKDDIRLYIVKRIREGIEHQSKMSDNPGPTTTDVLAADIGLTINLKGLTASCSTCGRTSKINELATIQNEKYGKLLYICEKCGNVK